MKKFLWAIGVALVMLTIAVDAIFCNATLFVPRRDPGLTPAGFVNIAIDAEDSARLDPWFVPSGADTKNCVMVLHGIDDSRVGATG